jgi:hypothetical protein
MQLATTAKSTSDNVTGSLSYINTVITGATSNGFYSTIVDGIYLNDAMVYSLVNTYGYNVTSKYTLMGTYPQYIITWG